MQSPENKFDVAIAGGGPAGASAAIELAMKGARVLLVEEKSFPRAKLCGEFISPECLTHFERLGVAEQMKAAGGPSITETVFYSRRGRSVRVPSEWFNSGTSSANVAMGLSRSEMDHRLLERAKTAGALVLEEAHATVLTNEQGEAQGLRVKSEGRSSDYESLIVLDATGRSRALTRPLDAQDFGCAKRRRPMVAFKAHFENARVADGACEIYSYPGGYGGLSKVEGGLSNLCFIVSSKDVREFGSDPERVMREVVMKNSRAAYTLALATTSSPWLSVSLEGFGRRTLAPAKRLLTIGDAASFIDPFTGSGMLMALESSELVATIILRHLPNLRASGDFEVVADDYRSEYLRRFHSRLRTSSFLRWAAFIPHVAEGAILLLGMSSRLRRKFAQATRHSPQRAAEI